MGTLANVKALVVHQTALSPNKLEKESLGSPFRIENGSPRTYPALPSNLAVFYEFTEHRFQIESFKLKLSIEIFSRRSLILTAPTGCEFHTVNVRPF